MGECKKKKKGRSDRGDEGNRRFQAEGRTGRQGGRFEKVLRGGQCIEPPLERKSKNPPWAYQGEHLGRLGSGDTSRDLLFGKGKIKKFQKGKVWGAGEKDTPERRLGPEGTRP